MHFSRPLIAVLALAVSIHGAPSPHTSLTKRNWCGFEITCLCTPDFVSGCVPQFDNCGNQWFWPAQCKNCGDCTQTCVDCGLSVCPRLVKKMRILPKSQEARRHRSR
ncbi:hypothetical protein C8J57DRAFT_1241148 [Mycena rebaudengoi]|nr:hypothetical protein C8J57DRAFT_1241148 [Mycena rebaudengoi]